MAQSSTDREASRWTRVRTVAATVRTYVADRPVWGVVVLASLVLAHALVANWAIWLNPYTPLGNDKYLGTATSLFIGAASSSAIVAGFAGVILVFTVGSEAPRVRLFRSRAGPALRRMWIIVLVEPFAATFIQLLAAFLLTTAVKCVAPWLFELGIVLLIHSAVRLLWLLSLLVRIVDADDQENDAKSKAIPVEKLFPEV